MLLTQDDTKIPKGNNKVCWFSGCIGVVGDEQCLGDSESDGEMEVWVAFALSYAGSDTPGTELYARLRCFEAAKISPPGKDSDLLIYSQA